MRFTTRRKYIYRLVQPSDGAADAAPHIAVHFVDEEKGREGGIGGLFVEMGKLEGEGEMRAQNREQHLCGGDLYTASWRIGSAMLGGKEGEGTGYRWWEIRYDVKGPKKDYRSETRYTLP